MSDFKYFLSSTGNRVFNTSNNDKLAGMSTSGNWIVTGFRVGEPTVINGLRYTIHSSSVAGAALTGLVGITTSLGPNGLFPYEKNNNNLRVLAGSAKTVSFFYAISQEFNDAGAGESNFKYATGSTITLEANTQYYAGIYISSVGIAGSIYFRCASTGLLYNSFASNNFNMTYQRSTGSANTCIPDISLNIIPYYYNGSTYDYYPFNSPNYARVVDYTFLNYNEVGFFFELNEFGLQDIELEAIKIHHWRLNRPLGSLYPILYDGYNTNNVIATGITEYIINVTPQSNWGTPELNNSDYKLHFIPPVKIRPDYKYYVGIAISSGGSGFGDDFINLTWIDDARSNHRFRYAVRQSAGGPVTESPLYTPVVSLYLGNSFSINRSIGN